MRQSIQEHSLIKKTMGRIPLLNDVSIDSLIRLGGHSNTSFKIQLGDEQVVLRVPGLGSSRYINRTFEEFASREAASIGIGPDVLFFDPSDGLMLTRFLKGAVTMTSERFKELGSVYRAAKSLRYLHMTSQKLPNDFQAFVKVRLFLNILNSFYLKRPVWLNHFLNDMYTIHDALSEKKIDLVPCHGDTGCENFQDTGETIYLLDFEFAGNNDPMWDLAELAAEGDFSFEQEKTLLEAYFSQSLTQTMLSRMYVYKTMSCFFWGLWSLVQQVYRNPSNDFFAYSDLCFLRFQRLVLDQSFRHHLNHL